MIRSGAKILLVFFWLLWAAHAQSPAAFEVASIKPNNSGSRATTVRPSPGGRFSAENITARQLIRLAYDVRDSQISGGPSWIDSDRYDVVAKTESEATLEQMRPMFQSFLADRLQLAVTRKTKELPVYDLVAARSGIKLANSKPGGCITPQPGGPPDASRQDARATPFCGDIQMRRGLLNGSGISMPQLITVLSDFGGLRRPVVDKTGFSGAFDVHLEFSPEEVTDNGPFAQGGRGDSKSADYSRPPIFTALQEQLGLRLESAREPVEMLVIDRIEKPSEN